MDGEITIGTNLNTDKFDRQIAQLEKKMQKEEEKSIEISTRESGLEKTISDYEELRKQVNGTANTIEQFKSVKPAEAGIKTSDYLETFNYLKQNYAELSAQLKGQTSEYIRARNELEKINTKHKEINEKVSEYKQKIASIKMQKQVAEVDRMKESFKGVGSSIQSSIKNVARLALGIFGVRSAFMFLRRASSDLASYDQQYATNLEYIRYALTQAIAPVLKWIVQLTATLLGYINAILQGWFGINLFSRGSAKNFNKMKAAASGASKAVKEIKKQLAGFDEINMLTDQSDSGVGVPSFDLSAMQGEPPEWLKWIIDNRDLILSIIAGITGGLLAWKLGLDGIKALGIGALITGIITTIQALIQYLKDPSWENFGKIIQGIGLAIVGLGALIGSVPLAVAGAIVLIIGTIVKYWEQIKAGFDKAVEWIKDLGNKAWEWFFTNINQINEKFGWLGVGIVATFTTAFGWITELVSGIVEIIRDVLDGLFRGVRQIVDGIIQIFRGDLLTGITTIVRGIANIIIGILNGLISGINAIIYPVRALIAGLGTVMGKKWTIDSIKIPKLPYLKTGAIVNMPNRGTLVDGGRAIAGEAGHEGIIPLDDSQAMSTLGAEIGKNVVVNLTTINQINGRVISRELKQIQSEQSFAFNN